MKPVVLPAVLLALAAIVSVACSTSSEPPNADPRPTVDARSPARLQDLPIDDLDPCSALTTSQTQGLGVRFDSSAEPATGRGPGCTWTHTPTEPVESYSIYINIDRGVADIAGVTTPSIGGFPALETQGDFSAAGSSCIIVVDAAPGQSLQVNYEYNGRTVPMTRELACEKARTAAELAMRTLLARTGG